LIAKCGKLAIAACILNAEARSIIRVDRGNIYNNLKFSDAASTWFNALFQLLSENCQLNGLRSRLRKVAIISFNYDRCVEHFLHAAIKSYYDVSADVAAELLADLAIYHPYGTVGQLPWSKAASTVDYGGKPNSRELLDLANRLRTFTEGTDEEASDVIEIRQTMLSAERSVFLGFAFHPLNMELLYGPSATVPAERDDRVYATALGLSESNVDVIVSELSMMARIVRENITLRRDLAASQLLRDYWRSLSVRS